MHLNTLPTGVHCYAFERGNHNCHQMIVSVVFLGLLLFAHARKSEDLDIRLKALRAEGRKPRTEWKFGDSSTPAVQPPIDTPPLQEEDQSNEFVPTYFATLNYSQWGESALLSTRSIVPCLPVASFGCRPSQLLTRANLTHYLTAVVPKEYRMGVFPLHTFPTLFDWLLLSGYATCEQTTASSDRVKWYGQISNPRSVYVDHCIVPFFVKTILPKLSSPFVLYTSGRSHASLDSASDVLLQSAWDSILTNAHLLHWFVDGRLIRHRKVSVVPSGRSLEVHPDDVSYITSLPLTSLRLRPQKILLPVEGTAGAGGQLHGLCASQRDVCQSGSLAASYNDRAREMASLPFLLCPGGNRDPSSLVWEAILVGTIPIVERSPLDEAFLLLPVVFVRSVGDFMTWTNKSAVLRRWLVQLGPHYEEGGALRNQALHRLSTRYWWSRVQEQLRGVP